MARQKTNLFIKIAVGCVIAICLFTIIRLQMQFNELNNTKKQLEQEIAKYNDSIEEKEADLKEEMDDDYIIRIAREKLGYHLPDEIVYYNDLN